MKKPIFLLFALSLLFSSCAAPDPGVQTLPAPVTAVSSTETESGEENILFAEGHLTEIPDYTLPAGADPALVREAAVKAMRDMLSVRWTPAEDYRYNKEGSVSNKDYVFKSGRLYAGLPYTEAGGSLVQFLQYYDFETGVFTANADHINETVGNMCGDAVMWGWAAVSSTLRGYFQSGSMTYAQGVIPVGNWVYPKEITTFHDYHTRRIVEENGEEVMMESYALLQKADAVTSSGETSLGRHTMMVIENANVVRQNGKIDPKKSTVLVQDQRAGGSSDGFLAEEDGLTVRYSGRTRAEVTFEWLFQNHFLPLTVPELTGEKPYTPAEVKFRGETDSVKDVLGGVLECNFALCTVKITVTDPSGEVASKFINLSRNDTRSGQAYEFPMSRFAYRAGEELWCRSLLKKGESYHLTLTAIPASGRCFEVADLDFTA